MGTSGLKICKNSKNLDTKVLSSLVYPITMLGCFDSTDDFATTPFHLVLFSAAVVDHNYYKYAKNETVWSFKAVLLPEY